MKEVVLLNQSDVWKEKFGLFVCFEFDGNMLLGTD